MEYIRRNLLPLALTVLATGTIVAIGAVVIDRTFIGNDQAMAPVARADRDRGHESPHSPLGPLAQALRARLGGGTLGVTVDDDLTVTAVVPGSAAADAGVRTGDRIVEVDGVRVPSPDEVRDALDAVEAGATCDVRVERDGKELTLQATKAALATRLRDLFESFGDRVVPRGGFDLPSPGLNPAPLPSEPSTPRPQPAPGSPAPGVLGVNVVQVSDGVRIVAVEPGSAAAAAGLQVGDVVTSASGEPTRSIGALQDAVARAAATGGELRLQVFRDGRTLEVTGRLGFANRTQPERPAPSVAPGPVPPTGTDDALLRRLVEALIPLLEARGFGPQAQAPATPAPAQTPALAVPEPGALRVYYGTIEALTDASIRLTGGLGGISFDVTPATVFVGVRPAAVGRLAAVAVDASGAASLVLTVGQ